VAPIFDIGTMVVVAGKRLLAQRVLAPAVMLGLVVLVALVVSLPIYADAINHRILEEELGTLPGTDGRVSFRSPFAFMFRYVGAWHKPLDWADVAAVDGYLRGAAGAELGLPRKFVVRYLATDRLDLFPREAVFYADTRKPLDRLTLGHQRPDSSCRPHRRQLSLGRPGCFRHPR
jgi:putative ABC transport system permease protein